MALKASFVFKMDDVVVKSLEEKTASDSSKWAATHQTIGRFQTTLNELMTKIIEENEGAVVTNKSDVEEDEESDDEEDSKGVKRRKVL